MKKMQPISPLLTLFCMTMAAGATSQPLSFEISAGASAVAVQFDVVSSIPSSILSSPQFEGTSPHTVESHSAVPGRTRHVVYSTTGLPISANGKVRVTFTSAPPLSNGALQISDVVASDGAGNLIPSVSLNTLPVLVDTAQTYRSAEVGVPTSLTATAVDPDGFVASVDHLVGGISRGVANTPPFPVFWTPTSSGTFLHTALATDNSGRSASLDVCTIRTYGLADISDFATFGQIHYGTAAAPGWYAFDADPLAAGIDNGIAYLLGLNPHAPDRSRLPRATVETISNQRYLVYRFTRRTSAPGAGWKVWETGNLASWFQVAAETVSEANLGNGLTEVTIHRLLGSNPPGKLFMQLEATP